MSINVDSSNLGDEAQKLGVSRSFSRADDVYGRLTEKDKSAGTPCYELYVLLRSDVASQDANVTLKRVFDKISDGGGKTVNCEYWGIREVAYRIKKNKRLHYYMVQFESDSVVCDEVDRILKNMSSVVRFLRIRVRRHAKEKSPILITLDKDISSGLVVYDDRYIVKLG